MNVVVTGGGTIAPIDDVRYIANVSTGRFSAQISEACLRARATVWHIHSPLAQLPFLRDAEVDLDATEPDLERGRLEALRQEWRGVRDRLHLVPLREGGVAEYASTLEWVFKETPIDVAFLAMAVSDFEPVAIKGKLDSEAEMVTIKAHRTSKVIQSVRDWSPNVFLVGFKLLAGAEPKELLRAAERACVTNRANMTVANDLRTLQEGRHTIHLVRPGQPVETFGPGADLARKLVDRAFELAST